VTNTTSGRSSGAICGHLDVGEDDVRPVLMRNESFRLATNRRSGAAHLAGETLESPQYTDCSSGERRRFSRME
jgi:hypothetical protein